MKQKVRTSAFPGLAEKKPPSLSSRAQALLWAASMRNIGADPRNLVKVVSRDLDQLPKLLAKCFKNAHTELINSFTNGFQPSAIDSKISRLTIADLLGQLLLKETGPFESKRRGATFSPYWLANRVALSGFRFWRKEHRIRDKKLLLGDMACGVGVFLQCMDESFEHPRALLGVDVDSSTIEYANLLKWALSSNWDLRCADSLNTSNMNLPLFQERNMINDTVGFDILMGNPPFVRSSLLTAEYSKSLRSIYTTVSSGNYDLSVAFVEHALKTLNPGGIASYILTNKFMTSTYGKNICQLLSKEARVLNIDDFHDLQIFPGFTTYTCVLTFSKRLPAKVFQVTRFPRGINPSGLSDGEERSIMPYQRLCSHPWEFASSSMRDIICLFRDSKHPLINTVFDGILQGLRTGANDIFVVSDATNNLVEEELLRPFVSGEHIRQGEIKPSREKIIFPYHYSEWHGWVPYTVNEMKSKFPKCWAYLLERRPMLDERAKDSNSAWYTYSRNQNLGLVNKRKLLIKEMMPQAEFAVDSRGKLAFCSGYALDASRISEKELILWMAVLCTPAMEFILRQSGTQLQSGWFRLLKHHLGRIRIPRFSEDALKKAEKYASAFSNGIAPQNSLRELDKIVSKSFGLNDEQRELIARHLSDCHERSMKGRGSSATLNVMPTSQYEPVRLADYDHLHRDRSDLSNLVTFVKNKDVSIHRWFKFTQGYSGELVRILIDELGIASSDTVLDPFVGCGTTMVECQKLGISSIGLDVSPLMTFVTDVKTTPWPMRQLKQILELAEHNLHRLKLSKPEVTLPFESYLMKAYSPQILSQLKTIANEFQRACYPTKFKPFLKMALISIMEEVSQIRKHGSHYRFLLQDENIGVQKLNIRIINPTADIREILLKRISEMISDVELEQSTGNPGACRIFCSDIRSAGSLGISASAVITSPPYLNRNNYIAQQKAELALLGLVMKETEYKSLVRATIRSHVDGITEHGYKTSFPAVQTILDAMQLSDGNNPKIPHMIAGYFEDLSSALVQLYHILKPGSPMAFVVGNTRWGGIVIPVDHILLSIAEGIGFKPKRILVTRMKGNSPQQMRQFGRIPVRESIVIFRR